ncbi:Gfo/Idh/MocA family protein [Paraburkholderia bannensis]|uniref:Gfo/Idh/MocA family protein n=1 Tax=Paraburkholderia bannensis TaxID=765414 RepID=UPI002AC34969|nr:Gfo/Idh/MocA family oxidoreductase [Paraburkholderia bannensis]
MSANVLFGTSATTGAAALTSDSPLRVAVVGTGFMAQTHSLGFRAVGGVFDLARPPIMDTIVGIDDATAAEAARRLGFVNASSDWKSAVADPSIDVVSITTPNGLHAPIALEALANGKHCYCEKPLAPTLSEARAMTEAAEKAGVVTQVGFNYIKNPILALAREMIASGELGRITSFRGIHAEGYMADPAVPWTWRLAPNEGGGAIMDLGSHIINMARFLLGPISRICADVETVVPERTTAGNDPQKVKVEVDDQARMLVRFARGCGGTIEASWSATGRTMQLGFEVVGDRGALSFTQERFNELQYFKVEADGSRNGFRTITAGPLHVPYGNFCVAPGHQIGFNDLKTIEIADFLRAIAGGHAPFADFREGYEVQRVIEAAKQSSRDHAWVEIA